MKKLVALHVFALAALLGVGGAAAAQTGQCSNAIVASARAPNGLNYDPPRHYDTEKLAQKRAVAAWQRTVAAACPRYSTSWSRAQEKTFNCEGYAGGISCEASARPARRMLRR